MDYRYRKGTGSWQIALCKYFCPSLRNAWIINLPEQHIEERLQAGEKRMGKRFGAFSRQLRGEVTQIIRQCLEEGSG